MHLYCWILAFLAVFMIALSGAQAKDCDYEVSVYQTDFLRNKRITFVCSYDSPRVNTIDWRFKSSKEEGKWDQFLRVFPDDPEHGSPTGAHSSRINGTFADGGGKHSVTVIDASEDDDFRVLRCIAYTSDCHVKGVHGSQTILYESASFRRLGIMADGMEVYANPLIRLSKNSFDVTFYAVSDPKGELSITGIDISGGQTCSRVDGGLTPPWNCSISATVTASVNISYTVSYMGVPHKTRPLSIVFIEKEDGDGDSNVEGDCECGPTEPPQKHGAGGMPRSEKVLVIVTFCLALSF